MIKLVKYIFLAAFLYSCEEIGVIEEDIPFEQYHIVNGRLVGEEYNFEISITKSFPIENSINFDSAVVKNVTAYVWGESQGIFPLMLSKLNRYVPIEEILIKPDEKYELFVQINDKRIYSSTYVPPNTNVLEAELTGEFVTCKVEPVPGAVYGCKYVLESKVFSLTDLRDNFFFEISEKTSIEGIPLEIRTNDLPPIYFENAEQYNLFIEVYAFDEVYKEYFETRENNKPIENIFSEGGGSVYWNVVGERTIGTFIGYTIVNYDDIE